MLLRIRLARFGRKVRVCSWVLLHIRLDVYNRAVFWGVAVAVAIAADDVTAMLPDCRTCPSISSWLHRSGRLVTGSIWKLWAGTTPIPVGAFSITLDFSLCVWAHQQLIRACIVLNTEAMLHTTDAAE